MKLLKNANVWFLSSFLKIHIPFFEEVSGTEIKSYDIANPSHK